MTSKISFPKLIKETLRRHLTAVLITTLAFFIHIIAFVICIQNTLDAKFEFDTLLMGMRPQKMEYIIQQLNQITLPNVENMLLAMLIGVYLAFDFFRYMHSKKETDFYESMPIKKTKHFFVLLVSSAGLFIVLSTITIGIELGIVSAFGYGSKTIAGNMFWNFLCMIGAFLALWITTVLAMIMTGHSIIAFLGLGAFVSYIPIIIAYLIPTYSQVFFDTYVFKSVPKSYYFSPVTLAYKATCTWNMWNLKEHWTYLLGCFVFTFIVGVVAYLLFKQRPSEAAGRAMAFEKINSGIRFLIVVPITLYIGIALHEMVNFASDVWLIFGILFGGFLIHGIMESVFQFDIKALLNKKVQLLITLIICLGFVFIFRADIFHYDDYIPETKDVESVQFDSWLLNGDSSWSKLQNGITGDDVETALAAVKELRESNESSEEENIYAYFTVTYHLKDGTTQKRAYQFFGDALPESLDKLSTTEDFKDDFCIFYHMDQINIHSLSVYNVVEDEDTQLKMNDTEIAKFCEIYREEYEKQSLSDLMENPTMYELYVEFSIIGDSGDSHVFCDQYIVGESFTETLSYLEKYGLLSPSGESKILEQ